MNKHDFRHIIRAFNCTCVALAAAGCANAGLNSRALPDAARPAQARPIEASAGTFGTSGTSGDNQADAADADTPTLTELKHFAVYQRFHGLVNADADAGPGAQYSGSGTQSSLGRSGSEQELQQADVRNVFSCLPSVIVPQADTGK